MASSRTNVANQKSPSVNCMKLSDLVASVEALAVQHNAPQYNQIKSLLDVSRPKD